MPQVSFPGKYGEIVQGFRRAGSTKTAYCIFGVATNSDFDSVTQANIDTYCQAVQTALRPMFTSGVTLTGSFFRWNPFLISSVTQFKGFSSIPDQVGTKALANLLPPNNALLVTKEVGFSGRKGRVFLPCLTEAEVDDAGILVPANAVTYQTQATALFNAITSLETGIIFNAIRSITSDPSNPVARPVTSFSVEPLIATQRRRLR